MTERGYYIALGDRLRVLRERCGMSQTDIAQKIGVKSSFISAIEKGEKASAYRIEQILNAMGLHSEFTEKKTLSPSNSPLLQSKNSALCLTV